jgi:hypothetical protein
MTMSARAARIQTSLAIHSALSISSSFYAIGLLGLWKWLLAAVVIAGASLLGEHKSAVWRLVIAWAACLAIGELAKRANEWLDAQLAGALIGVVLLLSLGGLYYRVFDQSELHEDETR